MKQKQHSAEEIIRILRQTDGDGTIESICREHNIPKTTFHRWRRKYGDMDLADAKRLKELERENTWVCLGPPSVIQLNSLSPTRSNYTSA